MFNSVTGRIGEKIRELEARLAKLEGENVALDETLAALRLAHPGNVVASGKHSGMFGEKLKFFPMASKADAEFFRELGDRKLNAYKLSDQTVDIVGSYMVSAGRHQEKAWLEVRAGSFDNFKDHAFAHERKAAGILMNANTLEQFKEMDKKLFLRNCADRLIQDIRSKKVFEHTTTSLSRFALLTFADLKKHKYLYWFGFPAFGFHVGDEPVVCGPPVPLSEAFPGLFESFCTNPSIAEDPEMSFFYISPSDNQAKAFSTWPGLTQQDEVQLFGFFDPSPVKENPGWFLRSFLVFASDPEGLNLGGKQIKIICIRDFVTRVPRPAENSVVIEIRVPPKVDYETVTGWEPNLQEKMGPRLADLSELLDEAKLSEAACNLNLSLMKWRAFPDLNDQKLGKCRVLLLGSGTLGCAVARGLMGWGFRHFTFCDSGKVSYSNPVRQSLFVAADCAGHGRWKAEVAAERCREIYPSVTTDFWIGTIPMPGHSGDPKAESDFNKLEELIVSHDVVCLLTDTRESRWLPTVIAAAHDKIVMNAALGFDSYVVMRHGSRKDSIHDKLGCYFCSDVVAPTDSTKDRTLDQQCTVTRPGAAPIASSILVELLVSLLHHPFEGRAQPNQHTNKLGIVPHQVRGFLGSFQNDVILGRAFSQCTACSDTVLDAYLNQGFEFVKNVLEDPNYLEHLTGLDMLKQGQGLGEEECDEFVLDDDFE